ncbi:tyrosine-type recombinase/integrase [Aestuariibacter halophilus]|uniref:Tyrosine-type recombinase/integrase n=1 Tax=Fluctibacter halophilus TaxID=226011 RepID=A0ABS8G5P7_9ALTE|nr:integrase domain-containing protein [Aestuariibacter halophilus]MCC2615922.1 tyrosine-type recombinase/integrase [Aestuariibacter halophilus]
MARRTLPLNTTQVNSAKAAGKVYNLFDGQGLMLRVKPNGSKLWIFNYYKPYTKKRTDISIGQYPAVGLAAAREKRKEYLSLLAGNIDPKEHRDEQARQKREALENTFEAVAGRWMELHRTKVTEGTAAKMWRSLEKHVFPKVGKLPIEQLTAPKAIEILNSITGRDCFEMARMVSQRMNNVMTFAVNAGIVHHNPLAGIKQMIPSNTTQNMPSLAPAELPQLMKALNFANIKFQTRCLIEWQLHTMTRPGEAVTARWEEIDFKEALWIIPAEKMKMGREHRIPLTEQAIALLELMKPLSGHREYIFPSYKNPRSHANKETANTALKRMGFKNRLVAHGMRSLASTTLNEQGFDKDVIEAALSHSDSDQIRSAYNRATYLERRRVMMQWWSEHIEKSSIGSLSLLGIDRSVGNACIG